MNILTILIIGILLSFIIYLILKLLSRNKKIKEYEVSINSFKVDVENTEILKEILSTSYEKENIEVAATKIIDILINKYNINYCTLFLMEDNNLRTCASNVPNSLLKNLEGYINTLDSTVKEIAGKQIINPTGLLNYDTATNRNVNFMFYIPLRLDGNTIGSLLVENVGYNSSNGNLNNKFFLIIVDSVLLAFQNIIFYNKIVSSANKDPMTLLYNRRYMDKVLNKAISNNNRFSIAMMDIDFFKKFNDTYGHAFGDLVLIEVSKYVKEKLGNKGTVFRYGGEEFLIYMNKCTAKNMATTISDIKDGIEALTVKDGNVEAKVTCSFGVAEYSTGITSIDNLKELADKALYKSKEDGRNRVTIA